MDVCFVSARAQTRAETMIAAAPRTEPGRAARTVLLVEDETPLRMIVSRNLTQRGHTVIAVASVGDAIAAMTTRLPDVVLLDVNLPDGTGWEVLRRLRAIRHAVRVIVYSAVPPSAKRLAEFHPDAVLLKPFPMDSLLHLIASLGVPDMPPDAR